MGWLASNADHGLHGYRHSTNQIGSHTVLISELRALDAALNALPGRALTLVSDSTGAIKMATRWMAGEDVLPDGYTTERAEGRTAGLVLARQRIHANRDRLTLSWARGHRGEPLNEGADALARLASRYAMGDSGLSHDEYRCRAMGLAQSFAAAFNRVVNEKTDAAAAE